MAIGKPSQLDSFARAVFVVRQVFRREPFPSLEHTRMKRLFWYSLTARAIAELGFRARPLVDTLPDAFEWHSGHSRTAPRGMNRVLFRRAA
jgi:dihydroflavonol-4-reductase